MSTNYFPQALMQQMLFYIKAQEHLDLQEEIQSLKQAIASKQKKHRRCDKDIHKNIEVSVYLLIVSTLWENLCDQRCPQAPYEAQASSAETPRWSQYIQ